MKTAFRLMLATLIFLGGCASISERVLSDMGVPGASLGLNTVKGVLGKDEEQKEFPHEFLKDAKAQTYLDGMLANLKEQSGKDCDLSVNMLRTARVQGLFYFLGDRIEITRGMLNMIRNEAELACLMSHEIGHYALDHQKKWGKESAAGKAISIGLDAILKDSALKTEIMQQQDEISKSGWGKALEMEADRYGAELAAKAGYDPFAFCDLFERLSGKVNKDALYRLRKFKGTHPALDERAQSLRAYLTGKGYEPSKGTMNPGTYHDSMIGLVSIRSGEGPKGDGPQRAGISDEAKNDLKTLDELIADAEQLRTSNQRVTMERFLGIMDTVSVICGKYGIERSDLVINEAEKGIPLFMEEEIYQDEPSWEDDENARGQVLQKVNGVLTSLSRIGIGAVPVAGDVIDLYEIISGRDLFSGDKLTVFEREMTAFGLFCGSGASWRQVAKGLESEFAASSIKIAAESIAEGRKMLKEAIRDFESGAGWKRIYSETANGGPDKPPYWKGISAYEGITKDAEVFYRVHTGNQEGRWLIKFDPRQFSGKELKNLLALETDPIYVSKVTVPAGTKIRVGLAGEIEGWGKGGVLQWELRPEGGKNIKQLGVVFEKIGNLKI